MNWLPVMAVALVSTVMLAVPLAGSDVGSPGVAYFRQHTVSHSRDGAVETWRAAVLLSRVQKTVGSSGVACVFVAAKTRECFGTYSLPLGQIQVLGEMTTPVSYQFAIVGGTGRYASARGIAVVADDLVTFYIT